MRKVVIEGNAVYEMDEVCLKKKEEIEKKEEEKRELQEKKEKGCD